MYPATAFLLLAASSATAYTLAEPGPPVLLGRTTAQGWSLQSDSAVDGTTSCGGGSYCPSSLHCNDAKNMEVAACCSDSSNCVGSVEGAPACADASWSLFVGLDGNGFCCEVGKVGVVDNTQKTMACVDLSAVGSQTTALLTKSGSGSAPTASSSSASASTSATASASPSTTQVVVVTTSGSSTITSTSTSTISSATASATATASSSNKAGGSSSSASANASSTPVSGGADKRHVAMGALAAGFIAVAAL